MKYCQFCGERIEDDSAKFCPLCGKNIQVNGQSDSDGVARSHSSNESTVGWLILGLFIPLAGLILYLVWKDNEYEKARAAGKGAIIGVCINIGLLILEILLSLSLYGNLFAIWFH
jgi:hypothetical protein